MTEKKPNTSKLYPPYVGVDRSGLFRGFPISSMPAALQICPKEVSAGRVTPEHLGLAIRALYHDGILVLEHVYDAENVREVEFAPCKNIAPEKLFGLRQDWPARLHISPLISQIAAAYLGCESHRVSRVPATAQKPTDIDTERSCMSDKTTGFCGSPLSHVPIRALAVKILLAPLAFPVIPKINGRPLKNGKPPVPQEISAGGVIIWDMRRCEPNLNGDLEHAKPEGIPRMRTKPLFAFTGELEFVLGMRNFRCLQCGIFNLSVEGHIRNCSAYREPLRAVARQLTTWADFVDRTAAHAGRPWKGGKRAEDVAINMHT